MSVQQTQVAVLVTKFLQVTMIDVSPDGKELFGETGTKLHDIAEKLFSNITYVNADGLGKEYTNGTFDGALRLMNSKKVDIFFKAEVYGVFSSIVVASQPLGSLDVRIGHRFIIPQRNANVLQIVESFALETLLIYLTSIALTLCVLGLCLQKNGLSFPCIFLHFVQYCGIWMRQCPHPRARTVRVVPKLTILIMFSTMILNTLLETSVKTDQFVLDLSFILNSVQQVLNSPKLLVWVALERFNDDFSQARNSTWQKKFWLKPSYVIEKSPKGMTNLATKSNSYCAITNIIYLKTIFFWACEKVRLNRFWMSTRPVLEKIETFYVRRELLKEYHKYSTNRLGLNRMLIKVIESGLYDNLKGYCIDKAFGWYAKHQCIYTTYDALRHDFVGQLDSIQLQNILPLVFLWLIIQSVWLLLMLTTVLLAKFKRNKVRLQH